MFFVKLIKYHPLYIYSDMHTHETNIPATSKVISVIRNDELFLLIDSLWPWLAVQQ